MGQIGRGRGSAERYSFLSSDGVPEYVAENVQVPFSGTTNSPTSAPAVRLCQLATLGKRPSADPETLALEHCPRTKSRRGNRMADTGCLDYCTDSSNPSTNAQDAGIALGGPTPCRSPVGSPVAIGYCRRKTSDRSSTAGHTALRTTEFHSRSDEYHVHGSRALDRRAGDSTGWQHDRTADRVLKAVGVRQ